MAEKSHSALHKPLSLPCGKEMSLLWICTSQQCTFSLLMNHESLCLINWHKNVW